MGHEPAARGPGAWTKVIGIVGGLGPHAHLRFEELLLREAEARWPGEVFQDRDYPPYVVASIPGTPDRTEYLSGHGPSPRPWLERSLRALRGVRGGLQADFAVIACNTAHALLPELRAAGILPILDLVGETVSYIRCHREARKIGLLATTGTLEAGIYQKGCSAQGLAAISLLDLAGGERLQQDLVMATIYGKGELPGIKAGAHRQPAHRRRLLENLEQAGARLVDQGAELILAACTEVPLVLGPGSGLAVEVVDPLEVAARAALETAAGLREVEVA